MAEVLVERPDRLDFNVLYLGDKLSITTGHDTDAWIYGFDAKDVSRWPTGNLLAINPKGEESELVEFELHGCGRWTDRKQNPVQKQDRAFTPYYDGLIVGNFLWGRLVGQPNRVVFDKPDQEISAIARTPHRENAVLQAIANQVGPTSVRQIVELIEDTLPIIEERDVRLTLTRLISSGLVSQLRKKVLQYELSGTVQ